MRRSIYMYWVDQPRDGACTQATAMQVRPVTPVTEPAQSMERNLLRRVAEGWCVCGGAMRINCADIAQTAAAIERA
jgi:hypothetical protein